MAVNEIKPTRPIRVPLPTVNKAPLRAPPTQRIKPEDKPGRDYGKAKPAPSDPFMPWRT